MEGSETGPKRSAFLMLLGAVVVLAGLTALVIALALALEAYPVREASGGQPGDDRSSAVVAVMTPVGATIVGIVGLYFGISATGSARGRQAQANARVAESATDAAKSAVRAVESASTETSKSATELAKSAAAVARSGGAGDSPPAQPVAEPSGDREDASRETAGPRPS